MQEANDLIIQKVTKKNKRIRKNQKSKHATKERTTPRLQLLDLSTCLIQMIWEYVPWDMPKINRIFRKSELSENVKKCYNSFFVNYAIRLRTFLNPIVEKEFENSMDFYNSPLLPCDDFKLEGYEKYMNQLANRSVFFLQIQAKHHFYKDADDVFSGFSVSTIAYYLSKRVPYGAHVELNDTIVHLYTLAIAFCGVFVTDFVIRFNEFTNAQNEIIISGLISQRIKVKRITKQEKEQIFSLRFDPSASNVMISSLEFDHFMHIWCDKKLLWDSIKFRSGFCLSPKHILALTSQPTVRSLIINDSSNLTDQSAEILISWLERLCKTGNHGGKLELGGGTNGFSLCSQEKFLHFAKLQQREKEPIVVKIFC